MAKGNERVIGVLNEVLAGELASINQYMVHAEMCENWGYRRLHALIRTQSIGEMRHAEALIERTLFLEGIPKVSELDKISIGRNVPDQLASDLALERKAVERLNTGIAMCREAADNGSRELLEMILKDEEEHVDWLEAQVNLVEQVGVQNYLAQQITPAE